MAGRFSVNKADPSVFISADDVRDGGGPTVDSPGRQSTGSSSGKPGGSVDAGDEAVADGGASAVDHPEGNCFSAVVHYQVVA